MLFANQVTQIGEGILLLNLAKIRGGRSAIIDRIPNVSGVYAWFRSYSIPDGEASTSRRFAQYLIEQAQAKHCVDRRGRLPPLYEVVLKSRKRLSVNKQSSLIRLCESKRFRENIAAILQVSFLFQQPLYVGKAQELAIRIDEHLQPMSILRTRLSEVGVTLHDCWLVCLMLSREDDIPETLAPAEGLHPVARSSDLDESEEAEATSLSPELVVEDVISRLFHPLFTERYG